MQEAGITLEGAHSNSNVSVLAWLLFTFSLPCSSNRLPFCPADLLNFSKDSQGFYSIQFVLKCFFYEIHLFFILHSVLKFEAQLLFGPYMGNFDCIDENFI